MLACGRRGKPSLRVKLVGILLNLRMDLNSGLVWAWVVVKGMIETLWDMDVLKASVGSLMPHKEESLLGALAPTGDRGSGFPFTPHGPGAHGGHGSFSRANLMDLFNMVSRGACTMAQPAPGGWHQTRTGSLGDSTQAASQMGARESRGSGPGTGGCGQEMSRVTSS